MTILFDVLLRIARQVDETIYESVATGGGATTLADSTATAEANDFWNGGTIFFKSGAGGRINTCVVITDFVQSTGTFTFATGAALGAGITYLSLTKAFPKAELLRSVNTALMRQPIVSEDETTAIVEDQYDYALPSGVSKIMRVYTGNDTDGWVENNTWHERNGEVSFYTSLPADSSDTIRLVYRGNHGVVNADSDTINAQVDIDQLVFDSLAELWMQRSQRNDENPRAKDKWAAFYNEAEKVRLRRVYPNTAPRYSGY